MPISPVVFWLSFSSIAQVPPPIRERGDFEYECHAFRLTLVSLGRPFSGGHRWWFPPRWPLKTKGRTAVRPAMAGEGIPPGRAPGGGRSAERPYVLCASYKPIRLPGSFGRLSCRAPGQSRGARGGESADVFPPAPRRALIAGLGDEEGRPSGGQSPQVLLISPE